MRLFEKASSYSTPRGAVRKLETVLETHIKFYHWLIAINSDGRYVPVITGHVNNKPYAHLAHEGVCVSG